MRYLLTILLFCSLTAQGQSLFFAHNQASAPAGPVVATVSDPDAQKFVTAAKISDATVAGALNALVTGLKAGGYWSRFIALYPLASDGVLMTRDEQHRYNLKDTALYKIAWQGAGIVHSALGAKFPGVTGTMDDPGYGNTGITPALDGIDFASVHLSAYATQDPVYYTYDCMIGIEHTYSLRMVYRFDNGESYWEASSSDGYLGLRSEPATTGYYATSRVSTAGLTAYKNGAPFATSNAVSAGVANGPIYLAAESYNGGLVSFYSSRGYGLWSVGAGFTDSEWAAISTLVNNYQTALNRNAY